VDTASAARGRSSLPVRAPFARGPRPFEPEEFLVDAVLHTTVGVPLPRRRRPDEDMGTELPPNFFLEVDHDEVRVIEDGGAAIVERWARGAVHAVIHRIDEGELVLTLRWPGSTRGGRVAAESSAEAREVAELLARDTRTRRGVDAEADAAFGELVSATLPDPIRVERHRAIAGLAQLLERGERPLIVAGAARGFSDGIILLTDRAVRWWSGGRRSPVVVPREEILTGRTETVAGDMDLVLEPYSGRAVRIETVEPPDRAKAIATALGSDPEGRVDPLDALLANEPNDAVSHPIRRQLARARELIRDGERPTAFAGALRGARRGALLVTDQRLLWVAAKGELISIDRRLIKAVEPERKLIVTRLDVSMTDGGIERFDAIEPRHRAALIAGALASDPG
jgi:hypothetical protein